VTRNGPGGSEPGRNTKISPPSTQATVPSSGERATVVTGGESPAIPAGITSTVPVRRSTTTTWRTTGAPSPSPRKSPA
jgi:hypothetical protein